MAIKIMNSTPRRQSEHISFEVSEQESDRNSNKKSAATAFFVPANNIQLSKKVTSDRYNQPTKQIQLFILSKKRTAMRFFNLSTTLSSSLLYKLELSSRQTVGTFKND